MTGVTGRGVSAPRMNAQCIGKLAGRQGIGRQGISPRGITGRGITGRGREIGPQGGRGSERAH